MKKILAVLCCVALFFTFIPFNNANADGLTASMLASAAYGLMTDWGISFSAGSASASGMNDFLTGEIESYVNQHGGSIGSLFVGQLAVDTAGRLIIPHGIYNGIKSFVDWMIDKFTLDDTDVVVSSGAFDTGIFTIVFEQPTTYQGKSVYQRYRLYKNNVEIDTQTSYYYGTHSFRETFTQSEYHLYCDIPYTYMNRDYVYSALCETSPVLPNSLSWNGTDYIEPTVLNPGKSWAGDFGLGPDTNLQDVLDSIDTGIAGNDLIIDDSEIIDDQPVPTPRPTTPPATDVLGGINDLIGQQDQVLEGIDTITGDVAQTAEAAQEAAEAAQEAAEALQEGLDVVSAQDAATYKFDLSTLFPFCIPFDIVRMLQAFDGIAEAPHVQIPFVIQSMNFSYLIDLDFSSFSPVAAVLRQVELIAFGIALAYATSKVIRW